MTNVELMEQLAKSYEQHGVLPVILCTLGGSGELGSVEVSLHPAKGTPEVCLHEGT